MDGRDGPSGSVPNVTAMTVLEIGTDSVRVLDGLGGPVDPRLARAALYWIDDPVGLYEERPVPVADLWRAVMAGAVGDRSVVVLHPDDWPQHRVGRVAAAADAVAGDVVTMPRSRWVPAEDDDPDVPTRRRPGAAMVLSVVGVVAVAVAALALCRPRAQTVVEGRVSIEFPARWTVTRVTGGPGSRRLQATPPGDPDLAVHLTQSSAPDAGSPQSALARTAGVLEQVIAGEPAGVFVDFRADSVVAGHPAVTYREIRPGRVVDWSVLLVGSTLIGIGCQSPPLRAEAVRPACERALATAAEKGTDSPR